MTADWARVMLTQRRAVLILITLAVLIAISTAAAAVIWANVVNSASGLSTACRTAARAGTANIDTKRADALLTSEDAKVTGVLELTAQVDADTYDLAQAMDAAVPLSRPQLAGGSVADSAAALSLSRDRIPARAVTVESSESDMLDAATRLLASAESDAKLLDSELIHLQSQSNRDLCSSDASDARQLYATMRAYSAERLSEGQRALSEASTNLSVLQQARTKTP